MKLWCFCYEQQSNGMHISKGLPLFSMTNLENATENSESCGEINELYMYLRVK